MSILPFGGLNLILFGAQMGPLDESFKADLLDLVITKAVPENLWSRFCFLNGVGGWIYLVIRDIKACRQPYGSLKFIVLAEAICHLLQTGFLYLIEYTFLKYFNKLAGHRFASCI